MEIVNVKGKLIRLMALTNIHTHTHTHIKHTHDQIKEEEEIYKIHSI